MYTIFGAPKVMFFQNVTSCSLVERHQCSHLKDESSKLLQLLNEHCILQKTTILIFTNVHYSAKSVAILTPS
jgi:hypothetical protein